MVKLYIYLYIEKIRIRAGPSKIKFIFTKDPSRFNLNKNGFWFFSRNLFFGLRCLFIVALILEGRALLRVKPCPALPKIKKKIKGYASVAFFLLCLPSFFNFLRAEGLAPEKATRA